MLGRIPQNRLYDVGLKVLNMYPAANSPGTTNQGFNYVSQDSSDQPRRQDLLRLDWQASEKWRFNGKYLHTGGNNITPYGGGTTGYATNIPQFGSTNPCPCSTQWTVAAAGTLSNTHHDGNFVRIGATGRSRITRSIRMRSAAAHWA